MKKEMRKGDVQTFKSFSEFEAQEGKITGHSVIRNKVMFWTKDGTYTVSKKVWEKMRQQ